MPLQKLVNKGGGRTPKVDIERKPREQPVGWFNIEMLGLLHHFKDGKIWSPFVMFQIRQLRMLKQNIRLFKNLVCVCVSHAYAFAMKLMPLLCKAYFSHSSCLTWKWSSSHRTSCGGCRLTWYQGLKSYASLGTCCRSPRRLT